MSQMQNGALCKISHFQPQSPRLFNANFRQPYSYIENLTPDLVLAFAATATLSQTRVLKDAIYKHVALQSSIQVILSVG
jgi:hypothetical protein